MDPLIFAIGASASGTATTVIKTLWGREEKALDPSYKDYHNKSKELAQKNLSKFLDELRVRTNRFEKTFKDDPGARERIKSALADPDFTVLQMNAMIVSTGTSVVEKHQLLARLVADRMLSEKESWKALAIDRACKAVPRLSITQLGVLGILSMIYGAKPASPGQEVPAEDFHDWWSRWIEEMISPLLPLGETTEIDYTHLVSVSCCTFEFIGYRNLTHILSPSSARGGEWDGDKFLVESETGQALSTLWAAGMQRAFPTSVGRLIGVHVHSLYAGTESRER